MIMAYCELLRQKGDIDAFIRHNFMIFVISKCKIKDILMLKLMFGAKFRLLHLKMYRRIKPNILYMLLLKSNP